ncbi:MAG: HPF/RaiA family ribosome-associated protein [Acidimicrobiia bacterium]
MQIQVNSDKNVDAREELVRQVEADVDAALSRFNDRLTRVEVHVGDESAGRSSGADMRCTIEARPAGQQPVAVTHHADTLDEAYRGAAQKLQKLLASKFDRLEDRKGDDTIRRGEQS